MKDYSAREIKEICIGHGEFCDDCFFFNGAWCDVVGADAPAPSSWQIVEENVYEKE